MIGRIDVEPGDVQPDGKPERDRSLSGDKGDKIELPEFEARSIREVEGNCQASSPAAPLTTTPETPDR
jgi:hypothetical protein